MTAAVVDHTSHTWHPYTGIDFAGFTCGVVGIVSTGPLSDLGEEPREVRDKVKAALVASFDQFYR